MRTKVMLAFCLLAISMMSSCRTSKETTISPPPVIITNTDSVRTVYIETVTIDTVVVEVPVPAESVKQVVPDSVSHLETSLAQSDAWINSDGTLGHSITNKPEKLKADVLVPQVHKTNGKESIKEREIPVPTPYAVEVERKWTLMEQIKLAAFWYLLGALIVSIVCLFRKPIWKLIKKIIKK